MATYTQIILMAAPTPSLLADAARARARALRESAGGSFPSSEGDGPSRLAVVAPSLEEVAERLEEFAERGARGEGVYVGEVHRAPRIAFMFAGQGTQRVGMGQTLAANIAPFRRWLERCDALLQPQLGRSLLTLMHDGPAEALADTGAAQPAIAVLSAGLGELLRLAGVSPEAVLGHSLGEYTAAHAANALELEALLAIVAARARMMSALPSGGAMLAVNARAEIVEATLARWPTLSIAAYNAPESVVVSGDADAIRGLVAELEARAIAVRPLPVSHAFHSRLVAPVAPELRAVVARHPARPPSIPIIANIDAAPRRAAPTPDDWCAHLLAPVQFARSLRRLADDGFDVVVELGPDATFSRIARRNFGELASEDGPPGIRFVAMLDPRVDERTAFLQGLAELYVAGVSLDLTPLLERRRAIANPPEVAPRRHAAIDDLGASQDDVAVRLVCFPYAGGGAGSFRSWPEGLGRGIGVLAVHPRGRGRRLTEPAVGEWTALREELEAALETYDDRPLAFLGHSLGALVAFDLAQRRVARGLPGPCHLFVSASPAPAALAHPKRLRHRLSDDELARDLAAFAGTPPEVLAHRELLDLVLPALRADCRLLETYDHRSAPRLTCPITALGGTHDPLLALDQLEGWAPLTSGRFNVVPFEGDHFFLHTQAAPLTARLRQELLLGHL